MNFGDLRSMIHLGDLPPLFATLPEDQHGYAMRMAGEKFTARAERLKLAGWLVYVEDPLHYKTRKKIDPALYPLLRWYACDVSTETMRMHGNGDPRSLIAIEVGRLYAQGKASKKDLRRARKDASDAADAARAATYYAAAYGDAHAAACAADAANAADTAAYAYAYTYAYADAAAADAADADVTALWSARYRKHRTLLTDWFRAYLMRWIEEGDWWEVSS